MPTFQQPRIKTILGEHEPDKDRSLRGHALRRATEQLTPRTLTPWEWEEWYAVHGVPDSHRTAASPARQNRNLRGLLCRILGRLRTAAH